MSRPGPDEIESVEGREADVSAGDPETVDTVDSDSSDIVDLAQTPDSVEFQAGDDLDVVDLAQEPGMVRLDEGSGDEPGLVRSAEANGTEAPVISEWSREVPDQPPSVKDQVPQETGILRKVRDIALLSLARVRGILKDRQRSDDMEPPDSKPAAVEPDTSWQPAAVEPDAAGMSEPGLTEAEVSDDSGAVDLAAEFGDAGDDSEAIDLTQVPETVEAGEAAIEDIVDIASEPGPAVDLIAGDDSDVVDLTSEPEIVRLDEGTGEEESEIVRISEEAGPEAAGAGEALEPPLPGEGPEARGRSAAGVLGKVRDIALLPLVKVRGVFKKEKPAADLGPGFELGTGKEKPRGRFRIPTPLAKAFTILFVIVCLVAGGLVGLKAAQIYGSRFAAQPGEPGTQSPPETTHQETAKTPAAPSKPTVSSKTAKPTVKPPELPAVQRTTPPVTQPPAKPSQPGTVDIPDTGKYDEPPYSKDVYQKGVP
ncbi:MAG: hypothetical protein HPY50_18315 [Firmicutes bacterium]|nr:hypothetical protein [Bacillota bacterium]